MRASHTKGYKILLKEIIVHFIIFHFIIFHFIIFHFIFHFISTNCVNPRSLIPGRCVGCFFAPRRVKTGYNLAYQNFTSRRCNMNCLFYTSRNSKITNTFVTHFFLPNLRVTRKIFFPIGSHKGLIRCCVENESDGVCWTQIPSFVGVSNMLYSF